jgi:hypothetical protein
MIVKMMMARPKLCRGRMARMNTNKLNNGLTIIVVKMLAENMSKNSGKYYS